MQQERLGADEKNGDIQRMGYRAARYQRLAKGCQNDCERDVYEEWAAEAEKEVQRLAGSRVSPREEKTH